MCMPACSYTDWYSRGESWSQRLLPVDTVSSDVLQLDQAQPIADVGSLCTVMIPLILLSHPCGSSRGSLRFCGRLRLFCGRSRKVYV